MMPTCAWPWGHCLFVGLPQSSVRFSSSNLCAASLLSVLTSHCLRPWHVTQLSLLESGHGVDGWFITVLCSFANKGN